MAFLDLIASVRRCKKTHLDCQRRPHRRPHSLERLEDRNLLATFPVSNLADGGLGSLRQAIEDANAAPGADVLEFEVAGTIELTSGALPAITDPVDIDGTAAPGFLRIPVVEVDANGFAGLEFNQGSENSTLRSLGIVNARSAGVTLNASNITLLGNFIGVELDGRTAAGNEGDGVRINGRSSGNTIGGALPINIVDPILRAQSNARNRNVISGNGGNGIGIYDSSNNEIIANYIGTGMMGEADLGNAENGILLTGSQARSNQIGGETALTDEDGSVASPVAKYIGKPVEGNLISGNDHNGVLITDRAERNLLAGNFIGTDIAGLTDVGNTLDGVAIVRSDHNTLRGTHPDQLPFVFYNVVSGNDGHGLRISDSNHTVVQANFFGMAADNGLTDPDNPFLVGNELDGVLVEGRSADTQFGGPIPLGSVVAANGRHGIELRDRASGFLSDNTFSGMGAFNNSAAFGNKLDGMHITSSGGNHVIQTSLFGANGDDGIEISGRARDVIVRQSIIGLNGRLPPGRLPLPNGDNGVEIGGHAHHNFIGPEDAGFSTLPQNAISANANYGVAIIGHAHHNQVFANYIGTNIDGENLAGTPPVGNANSGIFLGGHSHHNIIGGNDEGDPNLISGNFGHGVELSDATHHNQLIFNLIGSDLNGNQGVGNRDAGVFLDNGARHNVIQGNLARDNFGSGYEIQGSRFNSFIRNEAIANAGDGFLVQNSKFNLFFNNEAKENDGDGFHIENSNINLFIMNIAEENAGNGFHVENSYFNLFIKNQAEGNDGFGFLVDEILGNLFWDNQCEDNSLGGSNLPGIC